jgi:flagellar protein FliS
MYSHNYLENQIATASPEKLLIMFYDGAIRFTNQAILAIAEKNIEQRNYAINKATAIITELSTTLDHEIGGNISQDLAALYAYMNKELNMANVRNQDKGLKIVHKMLSELRETWIKAIDINRQASHAHGAMTTAPGTSNYKPLSVSY